MVIQETGVTNDVATVGATAQLISVSKRRKLLYFRNTSAAAQVVTLVFDNLNGASMVAGSGFVLAPGEYIQDSKSEGYSPWNGEVWAIASAAGATIAISEVQEDRV